jgi:hypothetical protein
MVNTFSGYSGGSSGAQPSGNSGVSTAEPDSNYRPLSRLKKEYLDYIGSKREEIIEQQDARRYRHNSQWTNEQIKALNKRKQPIVTYNRIGPKINGVIGLIEKLRQMPKGFARTPKEEAGADLATAVVRYVLDEQQWKAKSPLAAECAAVDGFGGIELILEAGDVGDPSIGMDIVDGDSFFYDPRSYRLDFSDCRYMGVSKWVDVDTAKEMFPDKAEDIDASVETGSDLTTNSDRENKWFVSDGDIKQVRLIDHWYKMDGDWYWCFYTGTTKLQEGKSYFTDHKNKTFCKFIMFSANIDQDGDRYGFVRQFKSAQDEINQRRSKGLHLLNSRRIIAEDGAFDDIERARNEATRPDGVIIKNKGFEAEFDDATRMQETEAQLKFLQDAKEELDSYGPTLSLIGEVGTNLSGRAISLQQQAGIAQLGPFILSYRNWKISVYRAIWNAVRQHWTSERWIRVTDDETSVNYVKLNEVSVNPETGMPAMVNQISALDVDIIMDEGPDSINMMADTFDALNALAQNGAQVPADVLIEIAPGIDAPTRKRLLERLRQPDPMEQKAQEVEIALQMAKVEDVKAQAMGKQAAAEKTVVGDTPLAKAQTLKTLMEAGQTGEGGQTVNPAEDMKAQMELQAAQAEQMRKDQEHAMKLRETEARLAREEEAHKASLAEKAYKIQMDQQKIGLERERAERESSVQNRDLELKAAAHNKSIVSEQKAGGKQKSEFDALSEQINKMGSEMVRAMTILGDGQASIAKHLSSPKRIIRDKNGRVSSVESN